MVATPVAGNNENEKKCPSNQQQATVNTYTNLFLLMIQKNNKRNIYTDIEDCKLGMTCLQ